MKPTCFPHKQQERDVKEISSGESLSNQTTPSDDIRSTKPASTQKWETNIPDTLKQLSFWEKK